MTPYGPPPFFYKKRGWMASIKASINKGLSINLKEAFPTAKIIDPSSLPSKGLIDVKEGKSTRRVE